MTIKDMSEKEVKETIKRGKKLVTDDDGTKVGISVKKEEFEGLGGKLVKEKKEPKEIDMFDLSSMPGVGDVSKKKLDMAGVTSYYDLCIRGAMEIRELTSMPMDKIQEAMDIAWKYVHSKGITRPVSNNPMVLMEYRKSMVRIALKCDALDSILRGGFEPEALYEVYGENGAGKTQICYVAAIEAIELFNGNVVWIDCEDTFKPERLIEIAMSRGYAKTMEEAQEKFFKNLHYIHATNTDRAEQAVNSLSPKLDALRPKLLIVDGMIGLFRAEYMGRGELAERQQRLSRVMDHLKSTGYIFNCAVLMTNQIMADPAQMFGDPTKPIGGNVVGHASTYRIYLKKSGANRIARLFISSSSIPF